MQLEKTIAGRLKFLREHHKLKQSDVAEAVGLSVSQYSNLETGYSKSTKLQTAIALADFYEVSLDFITGRSGRTLTKDKHFIFDFENTE